MSKNINRNISESTQTNINWLIWWAQNYPDTANWVVEQLRHNPAGGIDLHVPTDRTQSGDDHGYRA